MIHVTGKWYRLPNHVILRVTFYEFSKEVIRIKPPGLTQGGSGRGIAYTFRGRCVVHTVLGKPGILL